MRYPRKSQGGRDEKNTSRPDRSLPHSCFIFLSCLYVWMYSFLLSFLFSFISFRSFLESFSVPTSTSAPERNYPLYPVQRSQFRHSSFSSRSCRRFSSRILLSFSYTARDPLPFGDSPGLFPARLFFIPRPVSLRLRPFFLALSLDRPRSSSPRHLQLGIRVQAPRLGGTLQEASSSLLARARLFGLQRLHFAFPHLPLAATVFSVITLRSRYTQCPNKSSLRRN